jgi:acyl-CoA synthetase (AMP-forming)/AMP-acid ligase II
MLSRILDEVQRGQVELPSLRSIAYGGGRMPEAVIRRALDMMPNVDFTNAYGLTETSSTIAILGPEDHRLARGGDLEALIRLKSVGRPVSSVTVEVRDAEGRRVAPGVPGEVFVRGDQVSGEYVGMKSTDDDGWFPTKDLGWFDEDGYLFIDGRLDDVIVRGGENISPGEIEDVLRAHPAIEDVAIVGAPDDRWGERIVAFVVRRESAAVSAEELQSWVGERLRSTKSPQEVFFRTELPYNETGKLLRRSLRSEMTRNDQH